VTVYTGKVWEGPPRTVESFWSAPLKAPRDSAHPISVAGAAAAYEVLAERRGPVSNVTYLTWVVYGHSRRIEVTMTLPTSQFKAWEPVLRQMLQSFRPHGLD
jgi:hypothetical protein